MSSCSCSRAESDDSDAAALDLACCGRLPKQVSDDLELTELFARMWVSLGIFAPLVLATVTLANTVIPDNEALFFGTVWLAPATVILVALAYGGLLTKTPHPLQKYKPASDAIHDEIRSTLRTATIAVLIGGLISIIVIGALDVLFLARVPDLSAFNATAATVQSLRLPLKATVFFQSLASAALASYIHDGTLKRAPPYAAGLLTLAFLVSLL